MSYLFYLETWCKSGLTIFTSTADNRKVHLMDYYYLFLLALLMSVNITVDAVSSRTYSPLMSRIWFVFFFPWAGSTSLWLFFPSVPFWISHRYFQMTLKSTCNNWISDVFGSVLKVLLLSSYCGFDNFRLQDRSGNVSFLPFLTWREPCSAQYILSYGGSGHWQIMT